VYLAKVKVLEIEWSHQPRLQSPGLQESPMKMRGKALSMIACRRRRKTKKTRAMQKLRMRGTEAQLVR